MKLFQLNRLVKYLALAVLVLGPSSAMAQVSLSIDVAPPPLVSYDQPPCPDDGYIWTPGYWAYGDYGYYWVPGTWVQPPNPGLLWTPGYWGWAGDNYAFYPGYWGPTVGFYGGIDYGYGYGGNGYGGGRWQGNHFYYNTAVNNVRSGARYRYADASATREVGRTSFNGGNGGVQAQASAEQRQYASQHHTRATTAQTAHAHAASLDRDQLASANGGRPTTTAVATPTAYRRVAQQHAKSQPLTKANAVKTPSHTAASEGALNGGSSQTPARKTAAESSFTGENTHPAAKPEERTSTESRPEAKPEAKPEVRQQTETRPEVRPQTESRPEVRPQAEAKPQSHPQAAPRPQPHAESAPRPAAHPAAAKPEGGQKPQQ
jgi:hypothetical protein